MEQPARLGSDFPQATEPSEGWTTWIAPAPPIASNQTVDGPTYGESANGNRSSTQSYGNFPPHLHQMLLRASAQLQAQQRLEYPPASMTFGGPVGPVSSPVCSELPFSRADLHQGVLDRQFEPAHLSKAFNNSSNQTPTPPGIVGTSVTQPRPHAQEHGRGGFITPQTISPIHPRAIQGPSTTPAGPGYSYAYAPRTRFGDQQSDPKRRVQLQINYMDSLAIGIPTLESLTPELQSKEALRARLAEIAQEAIMSCARSRGLSAGPNCIDFKCFGSLRNGFGLPGADLDLAMTTRASSFPKELEDECPRILEKAFLDAGFGARLIENARVPIIKLCEKPSEELLETLRAERRAWEARQARADPDSDQAPSKAERRSRDSSGGDRSTRQHDGSLEFPKSGVGIQCDISFSGRLAIYNTELLRCYALCDERVRKVGVFVKKWAKARKINSPYHGTMCSYAYILMVIHYLINIVNPPLISNLQINYRPPPSGHKEVTTVDGYDVRFFNDEAEIKARAKLNPVFGNRQSVGELLRGFFAYYGGQGRNVPHGGFNWARDVISIRTRGGILSKAEKGWTSAKLDEKGNRHRFLVAIEDPFEIDHNVARTVPYNGLLAIRDEFRRAHTIINRIQEIPGAGWQWRTDEGEIGEDFFAEAEDRLNLQVSRHDNERSTHARSPPHRDGNRRSSISARQPSAEAKEGITKAPVGPSNVSRSDQTYRKGVHPAESILIPLSQQSAGVKEAGMNQQSVQTDIPKQNHTAPNGGPLRGELQRPVSSEGVNETSDSASGGSPSRAGSHSSLTSGPLNTPDRVEGVGAQVPHVGSNEQSGTHEFGIDRCIPGHRDPRSSRFARASVRNTIQHPPIEEKRAYQVNPLIRPPKSQAMQKQESYKQQVTNVANAMRRILNRSEPNNGTTETAGYVPADPTASAAMKSDLNPVVGQDFKNIDRNKMAPKDTDDIARHIRNFSINNHCSRAFNENVESELTAVKTPGMADFSPDNEATLASNRDSDSILLSGNPEPVSTFIPVSSGSPATMPSATHPEANNRAAGIVPRRRGLVVDQQQLHHLRRPIPPSCSTPFVPEPNDFYNNYSNYEDRSIGKTNYPESEFSTPDIQLLGTLPFHEASVS